MQTVMIYDQMDGGLRFFVFDGDLSELDDVYVNDADADEALRDKLSELVFDENFNYKPSLDKFPVQAVREGAIVIVCGFLP